MRSSDKLIGGDDRVNSKDTLGGDDALDGGLHRNGDIKVADATESS